MAIPESDPYYRAEVIPAPLSVFMYALAKAYGAPRAAVGMRGNRKTHFKGAHRSWNFCRLSSHSTSRSYTTSRTPGDRNPRNKNAIAGGDLTLPADKLIVLCRRLDAAVRSGRFEQVTEWYGNDDGDNRVDGFDNIANVVAISDPSHLWHLHMTFDRDAVEDAEFFARLLAELTEEDDMFTDADRNLLTLAAYGGANAARRADAGVQALAAEFRSWIADDTADDAEYLRRLDEHEARLVDVAEDVAAIPGADPEQLADALSARLGPLLTPQLLNALYTRLES